MIVDAVSLMEQTERAVKELAEDVGDGLLDRAIALQYEFSTDQVRQLAAMYLCVRARETARLGTLKIERSSSITTQKPRSDLSEVEKRERQKSWEEMNPELFEAYKRRQQQREAESEERLKQSAQSLRNAFARYEEHIQIEFTKELLASKINLRSGETTTWGEATLQQHEERYEMFMGLAVANAEGAARHGKAIDLLKETGAENLYKATGQLKPVKSLQELIEAGG